MDPTEDRPESFTAVHSKRLAASSLQCRLCPSMDLMVLVSPQHVWLHRTVSGQKLMTMDVNVTHASWRPDGRVLACANADGIITVRAVEELLATATAAAADDNPSAGGWSLEGLEIQNLTWAHVGRPHPQWSADLSREQAKCWETYARPFLDRHEVYLPPSAKQDTTTTALLFDSQTPLSVLCVIAKEVVPARPVTRRSAKVGPKHSLHVCLHGCFPVLQNIALPSQTAEDDRVAMAVSANLTKILCWHHSRQLTLYSIPALDAHRYTLQSLSALYSRTCQQLEVLQQGFTEIAASWKSSLKPLDMKLTALTQLLENYGLLPSSSGKKTLRQLLVQYILSGQSRSAPNLSNAVDQFFTSVQMNDQLMQRLERSLTVATASVEVQVRQQVMQPAQALVLHASEWHGWARHSMLIDDSSTAHLSKCCHVMFVTAQRLVQSVIHARLRLRDWVAWLRATSSHIKARGTARSPSKQRVPQAVVQRLLQYLLQQGSVDDSDAANTTEQVLDLHVLSSLSSDTPSVETVGGKPMPTLPYVLQKTKESAKAVFEGPARVLEKEVSEIQLVLPGDDIAVVALTTRQGCGSDKDSHGILLYGEEKPFGFYCPAEDARHYRQWTLVAQGVGSEIRLNALPLHWKEAGLACKNKCWTATLQFPAEVVDVQFYGDDGKSSLSSSIGTGQEGTNSKTPSLALLLQRPSGLQELWLVPYQDLELQAVPMTRGEDGYHLPAASTNILRVQTTEEPGAVVCAKARNVRGGEHVQLQVSGPRGMAAVLGAQTGGTSLEVFDLEEDEEAEDEEEDDDEEMDASNDG